MLIVMPSNQAVKALVKSTKPVLGRETCLRVKYVKEIENEFGTLTVIGVIESFFCEYIEELESVTSKHSVKVTMTPTTIQRYEERLIKKEEGHKLAWARFMLSKEQINNYKEISFEKDGEVNFSDNLIAGIKTPIWSSYHKIDKAQPVIMLYGITKKESLDSLNKIENVKEMFFNKGSVFKVQFVEKLHHLNGIVTVIGLVEEELNICDQSQEVYITGDEDPQSKYIMATLLPAPRQRLLNQLTDDQQNLHKIIWTSEMRTQADINELKGMVKDKEIIDLDSPLTGKDSDHYQVTYKKKDKNIPTIFLYLIDSPKSMQEIDSSASKSKKREATIKTDLSFDIKFVEEIKHKDGTLAIVGFKQRAS